MVNNIYYSCLTFISVETDKDVVNLSSRELTEDELLVLSRGLKFCPTSDTTDAGLVREDLDSLHKRLQQISFYEDLEMNLTKNSSQPNRQPTPLTDTDNICSEVSFKHRTFKLPAKGRGPIGPPTLEAMILRNEYDLNESKVVYPQKKT